MEGDGLSQDVRGTCLNAAELKKKLNGAVCSKPRETGCAPSAHQSSPLMLRWTYVTRSEG